MMGPEREMCIETVELMIRKIAHPHVEFPSKVIPFSFHRGGTIAKCK
jgi:hypothetical protein